MYINWCIMSIFSHSHYHLLSNVHLLLHSDASGLGYILLDNNFPQLHAPEHFLGDRRAAYGLNFVVDLSISNDGRLNEDSTFVR